MAVLRSKPVRRLLQLVCTSARKLNGAVAWEGPAMERDLGQGLRLKVDGSTTGTKYYICNDGPDEWVAGDDRQRLFRIDSEERVGLPLVLRNLATGKVIAVTLPCS